MKKLTVIILICLLALMSAQSVFAASSLYLDPSVAYAKQGDTVTFNAVLSTSETVDNLGVAVAYDSSLLEFSGAGWTLPDLAVSNYDSNLCYGVAQMNSATKPNGTVFYISFRIKGDAPVTTTNVSVNLTVGSGGATVSSASSVSITCNHQWGAWTTVTQATCTEIGVQERVCSVCGSKQQSYIDAKGHSYSDWQTVREATCTEGGEQTRACSVCGAVQSRNIAATGHTLGESAQVITESTCTRHGQAKGTCTVCGQEVTIETPFAAHKYGDWYTIVQATCTEKGEREHECRECGHVERQKSLSLGHDFSQGTVVTQATIYSTGLFEAKCSRCGAEGSIISPCSHTDEETGIYLETVEDVFPSGTAVKVKLLDSVRPETKEVKKGIAKYVDQITEYFKALYERVKSFGKKETEIKDYGVGSISSSYDLYEIKGVNGDGDKEVQKGDVSLRFPIPEGFGRNIAVYAIDEKGNRKDLPVTVDMTGKTVTASSDDLNVFALANLDSLPERKIPQMPGVLRLLIEALLVLLLIISWSISGNRRRKLKAIKKDMKAVEKEEKVKEKEAKKEAKAKEKEEKKEEKAEEKKEEESIDDLLFKMDLPKIDIADTETKASPVSSLRDQINEDLGAGAASIPETPTETPAKPEAAPEAEAAPVKKKPTWDDIFGEKN